MTYNSTLKKDDIERLKELQLENSLLQEENKKLNDTITWMHDTIWHLIRTQRTEH